MIVRDMKDGDTDTVFSITSRSLDQYYDPSVFFYFRSQWASGQLVACDFSGRPVGFLTSTRLTGDSVRIMMFAVDPIYRSKGIGQSILNEFRRRAMMIGARNIVLEVRITNERARKFYRRNGFMETDILNNYYSDGGQGVRMVAPVFNCQ